MTLARGLPIKMEMLVQDDGSEDWFGVGRVDLVGRCDVVSPNSESGCGDVSLITASGMSCRCQEIGSLCSLDARDIASLFL